MTTRALSPVFENVEKLGAAWIGQLENGGLFLPTTERYRLGQRVYLLLTLPNEQETRPVSGVVAWITPPGMTGRRTPGIGIHLDAREHALKSTIESLLAAASIDPDMSNTL